MTFPKDLYGQVNAVGDRVMADAAVRHRVRRFVNYKTCGMRGTAEQPLSNDYVWIAPADYYLRTKNEDEQLMTLCSE